MMHIRAKCRAADARRLPLGPARRNAPRIAHVVAAATAVAFILAGADASAAEAPLELKWDQLVPADQPRKLKPFFTPKTGAFDITGGAAPGDAPPPPPKPEGRWMSDKSASDAPAPVVTALDGKRVHIGGYVVPLDFDATSIKEFLLVPFVGACIHVPPPPANQIVYVKAAKAFDIKGQFDPVWVTGTMKTEAASTGLADAGYTIEADAVEPREK